MKVTEMEQALGAMSQQVDELQGVLKQNVALQVRFLPSTLNWSGTVVWSTGWGLFLLHAVHVDVGAEEVGFEYAWGNALNQKRDFLPKHLVATDA